jgi:hypothetical protein
MSVFGPSPLILPADCERSFECRRRECVGDPERDTMAATAAAFCPACMERVAMKTAHA